MITFDCDFCVAQNVVGNAEPLVCATCGFESVAGGGGMGLSAQNAEAETVEVAVAPVSRVETALPALPIPRGGNEVAVLTKRAVERTAAMPRRVRGAPLTAPAGTSAKKRKR